MRIIPAFLVFLLAADPAFSQARGNRVAAGGAAKAPIDFETAHLSRVVTAIRITEKITLDGRLDEPAWQLALPAADFVERLPRLGAAAPEKSEARFLYDDDNLYVGFVCFDSDMAHMVVNELKEDFNFIESDSVTVAIDSLHDRRTGFLFTTNPAGAKRDMQVTNDGSYNVDWDSVWDVKVSQNKDSWIAEYMIPFKTLRFSNSQSQEWGLNLARRILRINEDNFWAPVPIRYQIGKISLAGTLKGVEDIHQGLNLRVKPFFTAGVTQVRLPSGQLETIQSLARLKDYDGGVDAKYSVTPSLTLDATYRTDFAQVEVDQQQVNLTRFNLFFPEKRDFFLENVGTFSFGPGGNLLPFFSRRIGLSSAGTPIPILGGGRLSGQAGQYNVGFLAMKTERLGSTPSNGLLVGRIKRNLFRNSYIGTLVTSRDSTIAGDYNRVYGTDAHFQFYQKWEFDSYVLRSDTSGRQRENQARRFQSAWRDDELVINGEYNLVQANFNPEMGFVRRGNMSQYSGDFTWKPLLRKSDTIRNLSFGTSLDYFGGSSSGKIETRTQELNAGIQFENTATIDFAAIETFDRLTNPFRIRPDISIPVGDYQYRNYTAKFTTNPSAKIKGNGNINWGEFWNGHNKSLGGGMTIRPNYHLNVDLTYSRNHAELANGRFTTNLVGTRFVYAFTPRAFLNAFIQYNTDTHQVSSNIRFNVTHHPLSDLYLVYNDRRDTTNGQLVERAFTVKLTNLFSF